MDTEATTRSYPRVPPFAAPWSPPHAIALSPTDHVAPLRDVLACRSPPMTSLDAAMTIVAWTPATLYRSQATVELGTRVLGAHTRAKVVLERLTPSNFERVAHACAGIPAGDRPTGDDWRRLQPARTLIGLVTTHRDVLVPLAKHWTVCRALRDLAGPEVVYDLLRTLALPRDESEIWEPLLREAPAGTVEIWRSYQAQGLWQRYFGRVIEACTSISTSCPLAAMPEHPG